MDIGTDGLDDAQALVADDQEVVAVWRTTVLAAGDLLVRPIDAAAQDPDQHAGPVSNVLEDRPPNLPGVDRADHAGPDRDRLHGPAIGHPATRRSRVRAGPPSEPGMRTGRQIRS